jgi:hypothetical protein
MGKHNKKTRKHRRYKLRGGATATPETAQGIITQTITDAIKETSNFMITKGARLAGYVPKSKINAQPEPPGPIESIVSDLVYELNEQLEIQKRNGNLDKASKETVRILGDALRNINTEINKPEFVKALKEGSVNVSKLAAEIVEATNPAVNNMIDDFSVSMVKMVSTILKSIIKVMMNSIAAIPGAGAVIGGINSATAVSEMASSLLEASANAVYIFAHGFNSSAIDIEKVFLKRKASKNRVNKNIDDFSKTDIAKDEKKAPSEPASLPPPSSSDDSLPSPWVEKKSLMGKKYYYNPETRKSSETRPKKTFSGGTKKKRHKHKRTKRR